MKELFFITVYDVYDDVFELSFTKHEYPSLMDLIANNYPEEFGECKGRGLCGTCHVKIVPGSLLDPIEATEKNTLRNMYDTDNDSRLACQIMLNKKIKNRIIKIVHDN